MVITRISSFMCQIHQELAPGFEWLLQKCVSSLNGRTLLTCTWLENAGDLWRANGLIARYRFVLHEEGQSLLLYNLLIKVIC